MVKANLLSARRVQEIIRSKDYSWHPDGGGLYLVGSKTYRTFSWTLRLYSNTVTRKPRYMGLGPVSLFSLQEARDRARKYRQLAADGIDPIEQRRKERDEARAQTAERILFKDAAQQFIDLHKSEWKNGKSLEQWQNSLKRYAYPTLGG